jgi:hypothetical protein
LTSHAVRLPQQEPKFSHLSQVLLPQELRAFALNPRGVTALLGSEQILFSTETQKSGFKEGHAFANPR